MTILTDEPVMPTPSVMPTHTSIHPTHIEASYLRITSLTFQKPHMVKTIRQRAIKETMGFFTKAKGHKFSSTDILGETSRTLYENDSDYDTSAM